VIWYISVALRIIFASLHGFGAAHDFGRAETSVPEQVPDSVYVHAGCARAILTLEKSDDERDGFPRGALRQ
jgi:hypothetical protein